VEKPKCVTCSDEHMSEEERLKKHTELLRKERDNPRWGAYWLSFADDEKPKGEQFLGVVVIKAPGFLHAVKRAWDLKINPGGEVLGNYMDEAEIEKAEMPYDTLLSKAALEYYMPGVTKEIPNVD